MSTTASDPRTTLNLPLHPGWAVVLTRGGSVAALALTAIEPGRGIGYRYGGEEGWLDVGRSAVLAFDGEVATVRLEQAKPSCARVEVGCRASVRIHRQRQEEL